MKPPPFSFVVLDTETTGLIPRVHSIIEFASVRLEEGQIVDEYTQLFSIEEELPQVTQTLTRIRPNDLIEKPKFSDTCSEILTHLGPDCLIMGQNIGFDIAMLRGAGLDLSHRPWIDTSMIASLVFPELDSYSLGYMSSILELHHEPVHRALGDVHATLELIERCWQRLQELPEELLAIARNIGAKSKPAYKIFFSSIPNSTKKKIPTWLKNPKSKNHGSTTLTMTRNNRSVTPSVVVRKPEVGLIDLVEEPLEPGFLQGIINACSQDASTVHWIAVKNLDYTVRNLRIPAHARVLWPPFLLPDANIVKQFALQQSFNADEATLAIKLAWYEPHTRSDLPIHGNERFAWNGKIACTTTSPQYMKQFTDLPHTLIVDHRQLLTFLADPQHEAHNTLNKKAHIIVDDASSLEETATKAYGWSLTVDDLRAAAIGHDTLTQFTDVLQLWIEKTRGTKDIHILTQEAILSHESRGLKEQLTQLRSSILSPHLSSILTNLSDLFDLQSLSKNVRWLETRQDGSQLIHSVPECIDTYLRATLYDKYPTTLLIPPGSGTHLREILPPSLPSHIHAFTTAPSSNSLFFASPDTVDDVLQAPPPGKTIILMPGRQAIERAFITYAEPLEKNGCTLFCQGFSGGQSRFQSEFSAAPEPAILLITPWIFEGLELPQESLDHLFITTLPFDNPLYPTIARRSLHYPDAFLEYSLPRLEQRLFRMLRTFYRFAKKEGSITITDDRLDSKQYGKRVKKYLQSLIPPAPQKKDQMMLF